MWYERRPHLDGSEGSSSKVSVKDGRPGSRARWGTGSKNPVQTLKPGKAQVPPCPVHRHVPCADSLHAPAAQRVALVVPFTKGPRSLADLTHLNNDGAVRVQKGFTSVGVP
jgi:hypothetical protein